MVVAVLRDRLVPYVIAAACVLAVLVVGWGVATGAWSPTLDVWIPGGLFSVWVGVEVVERRRSDRERVAAR